ncbi:ankyrin repeat-containing protein At5g02620-like [Rhododendron vialii]|uniref:ankyrin repeat-containing protein At5g02620-like n=1 Tax=Rhododendron vialii TaxID=182163 RepID=UPI0026600379|nr:ankyrin repeat-containing protein At5g02620-like [Rhododendron vialii]
MRMGERINEAEITNVTSLHEINEFNLDRAVERFLNWTPLHVAASRGQQELFKELLSSSPELADALDSHQRSALHLASANGHNEIVKALTAVKPEMCLARDRDGANPLHVAAMRGKVEVLDELFEVNPHAGRAYRVDRGERETILHLCVKYNQLQFLSMLLKKYFKGEEFVNDTDSGGNTILHLAVADRRYEIIEYILNHTEIDVNATNARKQTARGILLLRQKNGTKPEGVDNDIQALFQNSIGESAGILDPMEIAQRKNGILVAAVLMATLLFQAAVAPPGGVWQEDKDGPHGHKSGGAVMASTYPKLFGSFLFCNMLGFFTSVITVFLIATDSLFKTKTFEEITYIATGTTMSSIGATYWISHAIFSPERTPPRVTVIKVLVFWCFISAAYLLFRGIARCVRDKKRRNYRAVEMVNRWHTNQV